MWLCGLLPCTTTKGRAVVDEALVTPIPTLVAHDDGARSLHNLNELLRSLTYVQQGSPLEQLQAATAALSKHFKLALVSVSGLPTTTSSHTPLAVSGTHSGSFVVGVPQLLLAGESTSVHRLNKSQRPLTLADGLRPDAVDIPSDWGLLLGTGLRCFSAIPIRIAARMVGVLTLAHTTANAISPALELQAELLASWLSHLFGAQDGLLGSYCAFLEELLMVATVDQLVKSICRATVRLHAGRTYHARLQCRVAVIGDDGTVAVIFNAQQRVASFSGNDSLKRVPEAEARASPLRFSHPGALLGPDQIWLSAGAPPDIASRSTPSALNVSGLGASGLGPAGGSCSMPTSPSAQPSFGTQRVSYGHFAEDRNTNLNAHALSFARRSSTGGGGSRRDSFSGVGARSSVPSRLLMAAFASSPGPLGSARERSTSGGDDGGGGGGLNDGDDWGGSGVKRSVSMPRSSLPRWPTSATLLAEQGRLRERDALVNEGVAGVASHLVFQVEGVNFLLDTKSLLSQVLAKKEGVWIGDCVTFMQNPNNPSADIVLAAMEHRLSSMVVDVMYTRGPKRPLLAVYLATSSTCSPAVLQTMVASCAELLRVLEPLVVRKLRGDLADEWTYLQVDVLGCKSSLPAAEPRRASGSAASEASCSYSCPPGSEPTSPSKCHPGHFPWPLTLDTSVSVLSAGEASGRSIPSSPLGQHDADDPPPTTSAAARRLLIPSSSAPQSPRGDSFSPRMRHSPRPSQFAAAAAAAAAMLKPMQAPIRSQSGNESPSHRVGPPDPLVGFSSLPPQTTPPLLLNPVLSHLASLLRPPSFTVARSNSSRQLSLLVNGLQDKVQMAQRRNVSDTALCNRPADLRAVEVTETVGSGGFGVVYLGEYQGTVVAIKVIPEKASDSALFRNAIELAVLSTMSHPNVVQVLTFFTDVLVTHTSALDLLHDPSAPPITLHLAEPDEEGDAWRSPQQQQTQPLPPATARASPIFVGGRRNQVGEAAMGPPPTVWPLPPPAKQSSVMAALQQLLGDLPAPFSPSAGQVGTAPPQKGLVIVMEYCEGGTLGDAIANRTFFEPATGYDTPNQPLWSSIYQTLLEVALALRYLHSLQLVHRDLKPANVLLKSAQGDDRGFVVKLSDFGLVKVLDDGGFSSKRRNRRYSGTITHVAPEALLDVGTLSQVGTPADVFAFGILMYELLTGQPVYPGLHTDQIIAQILDHTLRPEFPKGYPAVYTVLAERCWSQNPEKRPTAAELVHILTQLVAQQRGPASCRMARRFQSGPYGAGSRSAGGGGSENGGYPNNHSDSRGYPNRSDSGAILSRSSANSLSGTHDSTSRQHRQQHQQQQALQQHYDFPPGSGVARRLLHRSYSHSPVRDRCHGTETGLGNVGYFPLNVL